MNSFSHDTYANSFDSDETVSNKSSQGFSLSGIFFLLSSLFEVVDVPKF